MRLECKRSDVTTKWYELNLMPLDGDYFAVVISYGTKGSSGEDMICQNAVCVPPESPRHNYSEALDIINQKVQDRLSIGYVQVETKTE